MFFFFSIFFFKSVCFSSKCPISSAAVVSLALRNWVVRGCVLSLRRYRGGCVRGTQARRVERRGKRHGPRQRGREFVVRVSDRVWAVSAWTKPDSIVYARCSSDRSRLCLYFACHCRASRSTCDSRIAIVSTECRCD